MKRLMLCQDCLSVAEYSEAGHIGLARCKCGGDYCGCESCNAQAWKQVQPRNNKQRELFPEDQPHPVSHP